MDEQEKTQSECISLRDRPRYNEVMTQLQKVFHCSLRNEILGEPFSLDHYVLAVLVAEDIHKEDSPAPDSVVVFNTELLSMAEELKAFYGLKPITYEEFHIRRVFNKFTEVWLTPPEDAESDTQYLPQLDNPAFKAIRSLGIERVVPLMLEDLQEFLRTGSANQRLTTIHAQSRICWFAPLFELTKHQPDIPEEDHGDAVKLASAWISWGIEKGFIADEKGRAS